ncbi:ferritin-like domain-containing protein [Azotobacter salinestris]|uniref:ferritin-like domain-containing protein n=1 Tax=Azotobacter salinestris TaxID=69964 RepID=UPI0032DEEB67
MATVHENLLDWLRDAHAMEQQAENMLESLSDRIENYPQLKVRIDQHLQETRWQKAQIESCINRLGSSPSAFKDMAAKVVAFGQGLSGVVMTDEVVKGAMSSYIFENMEIASYRIIIAAAETAGDAETKRIAQEILMQEQAMADWLLNYLPELTTQFLTRSETPNVAAKR